MVNWTAKYLLDLAQADERGFYLHTLAGFEA
jgi:hypothetical protein